MAPDSSAPSAASHPLRGAPATVGLAPLSSSRMRASLTCCPKSFARFSACCFAKYVMSKPALNLPSAPVSTAAFTAGSDCNLSITLNISSSTAGRGGGGDEHCCRCNSSGSHVPQRNRIMRANAASCQCSGAEDPPGGARAFMGGLFMVTTATPSPPTSALTRGGMYCLRLRGEWVAIARGVGRRRGSTSRTQQ